MEIHVDIHFLRVKHTVDKPSHKMHLNHSSISSFCFQKLQYMNVFWWPNILMFWQELSFTACLLKSQAVKIMQHFSTKPGVSCLNNLLHVLLVLLLLSLGLVGQMVQMVWRTLGVRKESDKLDGALSDLGKMSLSVAGCWELDDP